MSSGEVETEDPGLRPPPVRFLDPNYRTPRPGFFRSLLRRRNLFSAMGDVNWASLGLTGPIRNQQPLNTCTSHAAASMYEAWRRKAGTSQPSISATFIHRCVGGVGPNQGLDPLRLRDHVNGQAAPPYQSAAAWPADQCQIDQGTSLAPLRPVAGDADARAQLQGKSPVVASLHITEAFYTLSQLEYVPQGPEISDHSVCLIGFNASGWFAQNSFGAGWGQSGIFHIAYGAGQLLRDGCSAVTIK